MDPTNPVMYYIDCYKLNSEELILSLVNEILRTKYNETKFYCHNFGGYDVVYILKTLIDYNDRIVDKELMYEMDTILRDDKILSLSISKMFKSKPNKSKGKREGESIRYKHSIVICDSFALLNNKLSVLATDFQVSNQKGYFPYLVRKRIFFI